MRKNQIDVRARRVTYQAAEIVINQVLRVMAERLRPLADADLTQAHANHSR
jgi:hypothetical protein